jgi:hypothetical protein
MGHGDVTPVGTRLQVEQAIQTLAPCLKMSSLDRESRRQLLLTVDLLTSVWSDLQRGAELTASKGSTLHAILALCEMVAACEEAEVALALRAVYRMVEGWTVAPEPLEAPMQEPASTQQPSETSVLEEPTLGAASVPEEPESAEEVPLTLSEASEPATQPAAPEVQKEVPQPAETRLDEARTRLAERLESLSRQLDYVQNHALSRHEVLCLLMASACRYRLIRPEAAEYGREWDANQLKRQLTSLVHQQLGGMWLPPLDPNLEFSEHELETLQVGYEAMAQSWQMWEWYQQHRDDMDKGTGAPLLESIVAPVPMVQQIWTSKQLLSRLAEQDGTETLREAVGEEAQSRKWVIEMLSSSSPRQRQLHYIRHADEHWEAAKRQVQKKAQQREAMDRLRAVLSEPNPDSFEEDLLCALVACHQAQIPYSNRELCDVMRGYDSFLENPAVPERCALAKSEQSAARKFLVNLGKHLLKQEQKTPPQEAQPEEEPHAEQNGELLREARKITQGKKLFMLCFNRRVEAEQKIREALQLSEVDWPDLDGSESVNSMEAHIRNADITVVVVHYSRTHWKEARDIARQYGKQFVMATRGYGVTHLAQQIVQQCARA